MIRTISFSLALLLPLVLQGQPPVPKPPVPKPAQPAGQPPAPGNAAQAPAPGNAAQPPAPGNAAQPPAPGNAAQPANQPPIPGVQPPRPAVNQPNPDPVDPPPVPGRALAPGAPNPNQTTTLDNVGNFNGQDIAELYNKYTGKLVLVSSEAAAGEISLLVPGTMTYAQAARIIEKKLVMEGYALVQDDEDANLVQLVLANSQTSGPKVSGPPLIDDLETLDSVEVPANGFVTYVMPLEYLKPDDALRAFQSVVQQFGTAGTVAAVPNAGSVVISGNLPLVRMLAKLKDKIDVPSAQVGTKFVDVTYADVEDLAEKLNEIFNNQRQSQQSARVQRTSTPSAPPNPAAAAAAAAAGSPGAGSAGEDTPINIIPQLRTSRIFLMGRPVDIIFVEGLIAEFDTPSSKRNFLRRKLRYLPVIEFLDVAAQAIERTLEATGPGGAGGARRSATAARTPSGPSINQTTNRTGGGIGGNQGGGGAGRAQIQQQQIETRPEPLLIGKTLLVADNISNSIVVNGPPHHIEIVDELVDELDQASEQVAITAVFGSYNLSKRRSFGIDLAGLIDNRGSFSGGIQNRGFIPGGQAVIDPRTIIDLGGLVGTGAARGLNTYMAIGDNFAAFVHALESNANFTSIARPTVFTTNNGEARLSSGQRIAIPTSTFQGGTAAGQSTNIEFRDITLELVVTPLVNSANEVTLDISLVRDGVGSDRTVGELTVPDINTDEISTRVTVPNKATIVLGGLILEESDKTGSGIPILSALPLIGPLLGNKEKDKRRSELVILIHPTILTNGVRYNAKGGLGAPMSDLEAYQHTYDTKSQVAPRARASVEGAAVLPERGIYRPDLSAFDQYAHRPIQRSNPNAGRAAPVSEPRTKKPMMTSPSHRAMRNKRRR